MSATAVALPAPVVEMIGVRRFLPGPPEVHDDHVSRRAQRQVRIVDGILQW
ncbi:hypothetical protein [Kribbella kalugense]|uniref:Uncharacterized protein n=1 Tax=Kribbella kalugense TaxID=2512221 RepID=A0A4R8A3L3_9ACTN|nr:hypothetical protein [Kribbella kalugense]TDW24231.1 hypothetical protein EV650_3103 [Kribbella kalugense]